MYLIAFIISHNILTICNHLRITDDRKEIKEKEEKIYEYNLRTISNIRNR